MLPEAGIILPQEWGAGIIPLKNGEQQNHAAPRWGVGTMLPSRAWSLGMENGKSHGSMGL